MGTHFILYDRVLGSLPASMSAAPVPDLTIRYAILPFFHPATEILVAAVNILPLPRHTTGPRLVWRAGIFLIFPRREFPDDTQTTNHAA
jgi:hypothetical protein